VILIELRHNAIKVKGEKEYGELSEYEIRELLQRAWMQIEHRLTIDVSDNIGVSISVEDQP